MSEKQYSYKVGETPALPRSKRRRAVGGSSVGASSFGGGSDRNIDSLLLQLEGLRSLIIPVDEAGNELSLLQASEAKALKSPLDFYSVGEITAMGEPAEDQEDQGGSLNESLLAQLLADWDYATQGWVTAQGYAKTSALANYYTKSEADSRFQPKGSYYTKSEADGLFQPKGSYLTAVSWGDVSGKPSWIGANKPSYAFSEITGKPTTLAGYGITDACTSAQYNALSTLVGGKLDKSAFDELFEKVTVGGVTSIKAKYDFFSVGEISAMGQGSGGAAGGGGTAYNRLDSWAAYVQGNGDVLSADLGYGLKQAIANLPTTSVNPYALTIQKNGVTIDSYDGSVAKTVNLTIGWADTASGRPSWIGASKPSYSFSEIGSKPTTLSGYGITDAKIANGVITLGANTITPLTSHQDISHLLKIDGGNGTGAGVSALINKLTEGTSNPQDNDYYVCQYAGGGTTTTTYHRRKTSSLWNYIKGKTDALYPAKATTLAGYGITNAYTKTEADNRYLLSSAYTASDVLAKLLTVDGANSGLDADLLDGYHNGNLTADKFGLTSITDLDAPTAVDNGITLNQYNLSATNKPANGDNANCVINIFNGLYGTSGRYGGQLAVENTGRLYWRKWAAGAKGSWNTIAFLTDNVASATKLQTARTLWGQSFDGSGNVDGNLTLGSNSIVGNNNVSILRDHGNSNVTLNASKGDLFIGYNNTSAVRFYSGNVNGVGTEKMVLFAGGNLALGRTTADYPLDVNGTIRGTALRLGASPAIEWDATNNAFKVNGNIYATGEITALGEGGGSVSGGGGGVSYDRLDAWSAYTSAMEGYVLSAKLGWDLYQNKLNATKGAIEGLLTGNITSHTHSQYLTSHQELLKIVSKDLRSTDITPSYDSASLRAFFQSNTTDNLNDGGIYNGILWFRPYGNNLTDMTGGYPHELGFTGNGNIWHRVGTSTTSWGAWEKIITSSNISSYAITAHQSLANYMKFTNENENYVNASFNDINFSRKASEKYIELWDNISSTGSTANGWWNLKAGKYIVNGGTSSQFLKADGSVDSNSYALASALGNYVPLTSYTDANVLAKIKNVDGSGSGLDADLLDGLHHYDFAKANQSPTVDLNTVNGVGMMTNALSAYATTERHYPINEAGCLIYCNAAYSSANQIYGSFSSNRWFARGGAGWNTDNPKTAWREFAFTDSNVTSASRLATTGTYTAWGQTYFTNGVPQSVSGLLTATTGATHSGIKLGDTYLTAISGNVVFQNNTAIRFGGDNWGWNNWAGLKYNHTDKTIYLGLADGTVFQANANQSGGKVNIVGCDRLQILGNGDGTVGLTTGIELCPHQDNANKRVKILAVAESAWSNRCGLAIYTGRNDMESPERVRIDWHGYVGVNTPTPSELFEVNGTAKVTTLKIGGGTVTWDATNNCFVFSHAVVSKGEITALN